MYVRMHTLTSSLIDCAWSPHWTAPLPMVGWGFTFMRIKNRIPLKDYLTFAYGVGIMVLGFGALLALIAMSCS